MYVCVRKKKSSFRRFKNDSKEQFVSNFSILNCKESFKYVTLEKLHHFCFPFHGETKRTSNPDDLWEEKDHSPVNWMCVCMCLQCILYTIWWCSKYPLYEAFDFLGNLFYTRLVKTRNLSVLLASFHRTCIRNQCCSVAILWDGN